MANYWGENCPLTNSCQKLGIIPSSWGDMQHYNFVCCKSQQTTVGLVDVLFWTVPDSQYINPQIPMATLAHCVPECYYLNSIRCKHLFSLRQKMQHLSGTERSAWDRKMCLRQKLQQLPGTERSVKVKVPFSTAVQPTWPGHGFNFRLWDKKKKNRTWTPRSISLNWAPGKLRQLKWYIPHHPRSADWSIKSMVANTRCPIRLLYNCLSNIGIWML